MSTRVEAPAPRNIAQEATDTLETQIRLAPQQLESYQQTAPEYAATDINILGKSLFGDDFEGNLTDINRRLTEEAALQTREANTAQRSADIADVKDMAGEVLAAQRAANPELFGNLSALDAAAASGVTPGAAETAFGASAMESSPLFSYSDTPTDIEAELQRQAIDELGRGDQLSPDEQRLVRVQSRAAADARGRGFSNAALADEVLNSATARQSRLDSRRGFASGVNTLVRSGQAADRGFALSRSTFDASRRDADRSFLGQAAQLEAARRGEGFGRTLAATQARLATFTDPFQGVLGRSSSNAGNNAQLFGNAIGTAGTSAGTTRAMFDPFNAYAADLYNTNYNAQAAAGIASANNRASLLGAGIGAIGMLGAGALAGPLFGPAAAACWVARAVYGESSDRWPRFRRWLLTRAPLTLLARYLACGRVAAERVSRQPAYRAEMRALMDAVLNLQTA